VLASCASTSDEVARLGRQGDAAEGLLVIADHQTGGRGRLGRVWHSPPGENLYLSLLLRPRIPPALVPPLTLLVGAVTAEVLATLGAAPRLKWPNDVLLPTTRGLRKAAGILVEMASEREHVRQVVVGVGLNVNGRVFPAELADRATSLAMVLGRGFDRGTLAAGLLNALEPAYDRFSSDGPAEALARWRDHAALGLPCRVEREGEVIEGVTAGIDEQGALLVRDARGGLRRVLSGELG
jgi:BirA family biotin operon repressor/biotin-[acetyl-CoA-carboxylase] ligase